MNFIFLHTDGIFLIVSIWSLYDFYWFVIDVIKNFSVWFPFITGFVQFLIELLYTLMIASAFFMFASHILMAASMFENHKFYGPWKPIQSLSMFSIMIIPIIAIVSFILLVVLIVLSIILFFTLLYWGLKLLANIAK
ncbi:hypothetical protein ACXYRQ_03520 [Mycoplasma sp. 394]